jgi:hypothetical protein
MQPNRKVEEGKEGRILIDQSSKCLAIWSFKKPHISCKTTSKIITLNSFYFRPLSSFQRFFQATQPTIRQQNPRVWKIFYVAQKFSSCGNFLKFNILFRLRLLKFQKLLRKCGKACLQKTRRWVN